MDKSQGFKKLVYSNTLDSNLKQFEQTWKENSTKEEVKNFIKGKEQHIQSLTEKYNSLIETQQTTLQEVNDQQNQKQIMLQQIEKNMFENNNLKQEVSHLRQQNQELSKQTKTLTSDQYVHDCFTKQSIDYFKSEEANNYDVSLPFRSLKQLKDGFQVISNQQDQQKFWDRKSKLVGFLGNTKSGKTFLMSALTQRALKKGLNFTTDGFNIVSSEIQENHVFFIDTPGSGQPLNMYEALQNQLEELQKLESELKIQNFNTFKNDYQKAQQKLAIQQKILQEQQQQQQLEQQQQSEDYQQSIQQQNYQQYDINQEILEKGTIAEDDNEEQIIKQEHEKNVNQKQQRIKILRDQIKQYEQFAQKSKADLLQEKLLSEQFVQTFIFDHCHLIILVVSSINRQDEKLINFISSLFQTQSQKEIIIVHNFYENIVKKEDVDIKIKADIINGFSVEEGTVPIGSNRFCPVYKDYSYDKNKPIIHLVMGLHNTKGGSYYNQITLEYLLQRIGSIQTQAENLSLLESFKDYFNHNIPQYIKLSAEQQSQSDSLDFQIHKEQDETIKIFSQTLKTGKQFQLRDINYDYFGKQNKTTKEEVTPNYDIWENKEEVLMNIDLPGIEDKNQIKLQFPINNQTNEQLITLVATRKTILPETSIKFDNQIRQENNITYGTLTLSVAIFSPASNLRQDKDGKKVSFKNNVLTVRLFKNKENEEFFTWAE